MHPAISGAVRHGYAGPGEKINMSDFFAGPVGIEILRTDSCTIRVSSCNFRDVRVGTEVSLFVPKYPC